MIRTKKVWKKLDEEIAENDEFDVNSEDGEDFEDSDEDDREKPMFSDDEEDMDGLNAANMEALSRKVR